MDSPENLILKVAMEGFTYGNLNTAQVIREFKNIAMNDLKLKHIIYNYMAMKTEKHKRFQLVEQMTQKKF